MSQIQDFKEKRIVPFNTYHRRQLTKLQRFKSFIKPRLDKTSCWEWQGRRDRRTGYGVFFVGDDGNKSGFAHRASIKLVFQRVLSRKDAVCHRCDNRPCIRPSHLVVADQKYNAQDRQRKGRSNSPRGDNHYNTKLMDSQIPIVLALRDEGKTLVDIAQLFGVCRETIGKIVRGERRA